MRQRREVAGGHNVLNCTSLPNVIEDRGKRLRRRAKIHSERGGGSGGVPVFMYIYSIYPKNSFLLYILSVMPNSVSNSMLPVSSASVHHQPHLLSISGLATE
jgi:hypothetical protein